MPRPAIVADPGTKLWQRQLQAAVDWLGEEFSVTPPDITARFGSKLFKTQVDAVLEQFDTDCPLTERPEITARPGTKLFERQLVAALDYIENNCSTGPSPLPSVTNLLSEPFDFTDPAFELDSPESIQITSGISDPFGGTGAYRLADMNGFSYILQFYTSLGSGTVYYNDVWLRMVSAGGGTGLSADVGLYHPRLDWVEVTLTSNWNWYRVPRLGRSVGDNSWGINLQNNTVIEVYHARAFIDAYNGDPTYSLIEGPYA